MNAPQQQAPGPQGILWIACYPRSGGTWMRMFLYHLIRIIGGHTLSDHYINDLPRLAPLESARTDLFRRFLGKPVGEATWDEVLPVRPKIHAAIAAESDGPAIAATHNALGLVQETPLVNMEITSGAIYVLRNPLDVAVSMAAYFGVSIDEAIDRMGMEGCQTDNTADRAYEHPGSWSENVASWAGSQQPTIFPVRYEDMLNIPRDVFESVVKFLGHRATPEQFAEAIELSSFERLQAMEREVGFREGHAKHLFFRSGRAGQWRDAMTEEQIARLVADHHVIMKWAGYLTDELARFAPVSSPTPS